MIPESRNFIFTVKNIKEIYENISSLKVECCNKNLLPPIEDVFINSFFDIASNKLSLMGIIKGKNLETKHVNNENYALISDKNNNPEFTIRNINNFGIYVFAGRPDLCHQKYNSPCIILDSLENFKNKLEKFANLMELLVNEAYTRNNIELAENIEYKFISIKIQVKNKQTIVQKRELPEALKRFYARINE